MKRWLKYSVISLLLIIILYGLTYVPHKIMTTSPSKVFTIEVMDGNKGKQTTIESRDEIEYIVSNLNEVTFQKGKLSIFYMGYSYRMRF